MARGPGGTSRLHLQTLFSVGVTAALTDGQLLERFATLRGEAAELALAAIVERHGLMVLRACRGILGDEHDAHDAFQATFLVLLHKGKTLWVRDSLGPWLHRVACRASARARVESQRRRVHERRAAEQAAGRRRGAGTSELAAVVHEEVDRLPDRYRQPIVLCDLQGQSYEEAAQHLRCPIGTVRSRLARGRERLRLGLTRRGLAPSAAVAGAVLAPDAASAAVPAAWVGSLNASARCIQAGGALAAGAVPASVLAITTGVLKMISHGKQTLIAAGVLTALGLAIGAGVLAQQTSEEPPPPAAQAPVDGSDRRWVATLPNGGSLEVLGVSTYPTGPDTWWRPDGSPLAEAPCDSPRRNLSVVGSIVYRVIAVRLSGFPEDANTGWDVNEARGSGGPSVAKKEGKELPGVRANLVAVPPDLATCSVDLRAAGGRWRTLGSNDGQSPGATGSNKVGCIFGEALAARKGTIITVSHNISDAAWRLIAIDRAGRERPTVSHRGSGVKDFYQVAAEFDLAPEAIQEYRLQTRPFEHVALKNIARCGPTLQGELLQHAGQRLWAPWRASAQARSRWDRP